MSPITVSSICQRVIRSLCPRNGTIFSPHSTWGAITLAMVAFSPLFRSAVPNCVYIRLPLDQLPLDRPALRFRPNSRQAHPELRSFSPSGDPEAGPQLTL